MKERGIVCTIIRHKYNLFIGNGNTSALHAVAAGIISAT